MIRQLIPRGRHRMVDERLRADRRGLPCGRTISTMHGIRVAINVFPAFIAAKIGRAAPPGAHRAGVRRRWAEDRFGIAYACTSGCRRASRKARLSLTRLDALQVSHASDPFTAVFLAQALDDREMKRLLTFARTHHVLSFSPTARRHRGAVSSAASRSATAFFQRSISSP